jgi:hypothetical protein
MNFLASLAFYGSLAAVLVFSLAFGAFAVWLLHRLADWMEGRER